MGRYTDQGPVLLSKVRGSSKTRPRARHEWKREEGREEKGDDANASQHGGMVKHSRSKVGSGEKWTRRAKAIVREEEKRKRGGLLHTGVACLSTSILEGLYTSQSRASKQKI
jgi:hypothetical protein